MNAALLTPHVLSAIHIDDVDDERPAVVVIDPESGKLRPGVTVDALMRKLQLDEDFKGLFGAEAMKSRRTADKRAPLAAIHGSPVIITTPQNKPNSCLTTRRSHSA